MKALCIKSVESYKEGQLYGFTELIDTWGSIKLVSVLVKKEPGVKDWMFNEKEFKEHFRRFL